VWRGGVSTHGVTTCNTLYINHIFLQPRPLQRPTLSPRRRMPCTVGIRGSSQPSTRPVSTNQVSLRLDRIVLTKLRLGGWGGLVGNKNGLI
jgi:hypothetical protein